MSDSHPQSTAYLRGEWIEAEVCEGGEVLEYRIRQQKPLKAEQYPHLLTITWEGERMPERQKEFEQRLIGWLESYKVAWLMVAFRGHGTQEWYWYTRNPEECMNFVNLALEEAEPFPVEFALQDDAKWKVYQEIRGQLKG